MEYPTRFLRFLDKYLIHANKQVYFKLTNSEQEEALTDVMFGKRWPIEFLPYEIYLTPKVYFRELRRRGFEIESVEVRNLGDLPLEERNRIKREARSPERQQEVLNRLRKENQKYGD